MTYKSYVMIALISRSKGMRKISQDEIIRETTCAMSVQTIFDSCMTVVAISRCDSASISHTFSAEGHCQIRPLCPQSILDLALFVVMWPIRVYDGDEKVIISMDVGTTFSMEKNDVEASCWR